MYCIETAEDILQQLTLGCGRLDSSFLRSGLGQPEMEPGHWVNDFGRVGSRVSVSDPVFDPVLCFNMCVYHDVVSTE